MKFRRGQQTGWSGELAVNAGAGVLSLEVEDERGEIQSAPVTITVEPVRTSPGGALADINDAELELSWGDIYGTSHEALIDVGRGMIVTVAAARVEAQLRNLGGGSGAPGRWRVAAGLGATSRPTAAVRGVNIGPLGAAAETADLIVPTWAREWTLARVPQVECLVQFRRFPAAVIAEYLVPADQDPVLTVPTGASMVRVRNNDGATPITASRIQFELAL